MYHTEVSRPHPSTIIKGNWLVWQLDVCIKVEKRLVPGQDFQQKGLLLHPSSSCLEKPKN